MVEYVFFHGKETAMSELPIIVVGAGAAGLLAAAEAAKAGAAVCLIERNPRPARKVMITGKGRCNVTNNTTPEGIIANTPTNGRFLYSAMNQWTPQDTMDLLEAQGVPLKTERGNRVFPVSDKAVDIGEEDVILGMSFPRYSSKAVSILDFARSRKAKVIAITDSLLSPIADYADHLLLAHSDLATVVDSLVAPLSILNALIVAVSLKRMEENRDSLEMLETIWSRYGVYQALPEPPTAEP